MTSEVVHSAAELIEFTARALVRDPDAVSIEVEKHPEKGDVVQLRVAPDDVGRIIGKQGRTISALRVLLRAFAKSRGSVPYGLEIEDPED